MIVWFLRARTFEPSVVVSFSYFCFCFCFFKETRIRTESAELIVKCPLPTPLVYNRMWKWKERKKGLNSVCRRNDERKTAKEQSVLNSQEEEEERSSKLLRNVDRSRRIREKYGQELHSTAQPSYSRATSFLYFFQNKTRNKTLALGRKRERKKEEGPPIRRW